MKEWCVFGLAADGSCWRVYDFAMPRRRAERLARWLSRRRVLRRIGNRYEAHQFRWKGRP